MAAKGQYAKQEIMAKILETFGDNSFLYNDNKEIRINTIENGELVQIKLTLTAAKVPVEGGSENELPGQDTSETMAETAAKVSSTEPLEVSQEEKENLRSLITELGL